MRKGDEREPMLQGRRQLRSSGTLADMSPAYTAAIEKHLPEALHVYDRFHVMKLFNEKMTSLRRRLHGEASDKDEKEALKGIRFALLLSCENILNRAAPVRSEAELKEAADPRRGGWTNGSKFIRGSIKREPNEKESVKLKKALTLSADLTVAHTLKDELHELWEADTEEDAMRLLSEWITDAEWSQIPEMPAFAKTLRNHWEKIMNYYCCELTSGPLEGLNNKIKTLKRQSYGFRDQEYFKLKILAIHRTRYALVG